MQFLILAFVLVGWNITSAQGQGPSSPTILTASPQSTFITLTWSQSPGDMVDSYNISYSYTIRGCGTPVNNVPAPPAPGSSRVYNLTGLEENSDFTISITAINGTGSSPPTTTTARTAIAAPSAPPVDLMVSSTSPTSISLSWEEVPCAGRNVDRITEYQIVTRTTSDNVIRGRVRRHGTRMFTANRLIPRTNYTFEVTARYDDINLNNPLFGPAAVITEVTAVPQAVGFFLKGVLYSNNSVVSLTDIGEGYNALHCLTNLTTCCRGEDGGSAGEWFLPGQTSPVVDVSAPNADFTRSRGPSAVLLNRRTGAVEPTGLFTCQVPDGSGMETLYIGIMRMGSSVPAIIDLDYDRASGILTCISSGGPVDSVTWTKDGSLITGDSSTFSQNQTITNAISSTYHHTLSSSDSSNFVGSFTCTIRDEAGNSNSRTRVFNGIEISNDLFVVGSRAVVNCSSDSGVVDRIEWVSREGEVLASGTSIQQLMHVVDPVRDDLHGSEFICSVTRNQMILNQTLPITVRVPENAISVSISRSGEPVAGSVFDLICTVSEVISGLTNMPTAAWLDSNNMVITQDTTDSRSDNISSSILRFNPLRTSLQQRYRCSGSIVSPALPNPVRVTTDSTFIIEISTPTVSTTVPSGPLFAGGVDNVTLTCSAMLGSGVDNPAVIRYNYTWLDREGREIVSGGRTIITPTTPSISSSSTLTLSPLSTTDTNFTCRVTLSDSRNLLRPSDPGEQRTDVNVLTPSAMVRINSVGESTAGINHTLICTVTLEQDLRAPLLIQWTAPNGSIIENETLEDVTVSRSSNNLSLTFDPLHTRHGGQYSCMASVNVPEANIFISGQASHNITVQYPHLVILTGEHITNEVVTLIGNVTLTPSTSGNPTFSYTWQVPSGLNITTSTGGYTVNQGSLNVSYNIQNITGSYTLYVCANISEIGVVDLCNSTSITLTLPTTPPTTTTPSTSPDGAGLSTGASIAIGVVVAVIIILIVLVAVVICCAYCKRTTTKKTAYDRKYDVNDGDFQLTDNVYDEAKVSDHVYDEARVSDPSTFKASPDPVNPEGNNEGPTPEDNNDAGPVKPEESSAGPVKPEESNGGPSPVEPEATPSQDKVLLDQVAPEHSTFKA